MIKNSAKIISLVLTLIFACTGGLTYIHSMFVSKYAFELNKQSQTNTLKSIDNRLTDIQKILMGD